MALSSFVAIGSPLKWASRSWVRVSACSALRVVDDRGRALLVRAVRAAIERAVRFDAVSDDAAAAVIAHRSEPVDRAFEAVEYVGLARGHHLERQIVVIPADFARRHIDLPAVAGPSARPDNKRGRVSGILPAGG